MTTATVRTEAPQTVPPPPLPCGDKRIVLHGIPWQIYLDMLNSKRDNGVPRFAYTGETLEIFMPSRQHEQISGWIRYFLTGLALAWGFDFRDFGTTTYRRDDVERGFEGDISYYFDDLQRFEGKEDIDLNTDPPPALVVEVDIRSASLNKRPIYAALGIRELWVFKDDTLRIFLLTGDGYEEQTHSARFPTLPVAVINGFLGAANGAHTVGWINSVREWAQQNPPPAVVAPSPA